MNNQSEQKELHVSTESRCTDSRRTPGGSRLCRFNRWRVKEAKHSKCCLFLLLSSHPEIRSSKESNSGGFCSLSGLWSGTQTAGTFFIPDINVCLLKTLKESWKLCSLKGILPLFFLVVSSREQFFSERWSFSEKLSMDYKHWCFCLCCWTDYPPGISLTPLEALRDIKRESLTFWMKLFLFFSLRSIRGSSRLFFSGWTDCKDSLKHHRGL